MPLKPQPPLQPLKAFTYKALTHPCPHSQVNELTAKACEATDVSVGNGHNTEVGSNPFIANIPLQMPYRHLGIDLTRTERTMDYCDDWTRTYNANPAPNPQQARNRARGAARR